MHKALASMLNVAPLDLSHLIVNLLLGVIMALVIRWHYIRFGSTLSNRSQFAQVFAFIILTTTLIITIVKSSLALSLGLVGALSIVRFRTPIKEPEELAYLFFCIAIGLGFGAEQTLPTLSAAVIILVLMAALRWRHMQYANRNLYLSLDWQGGEKGNLDQITNIISKHTLTSDIRRYDSRSTGDEAIYYVELADSGKLTTLMTELKSTLPGIGVTFIDQNQIPSV